MRGLYWSEPVSGSNTQGRQQSSCVKRPEERRNERKMTRMGISNISKEKKALERTRPSGRFARELSLWGLLAGGSIYKILVILVLLAVGQCALFYVSLTGRAKQGQLSGADFESLFSFSGGNVSYLSACGFLFLAAFALIMFTLTRCETVNSGSIFYYTLRRLRVSERHLFFVETLYNFLCFVLLFAVQIWVILWMYRMYMNRIPGDPVSHQIAFLAFYRVPFLHNLLPLAETGKWVRNLLMLLAVSMDAATEKAGQSKRGFQTWYCLVLVGAWWMVTDVGFHFTDVFMGVIFGIIILVSLMKILGFWISDGSVLEQEE